MIDLKQFVSEEYCLKCRGCCRFNQQDSVWLPSLLSEEIDNLLAQNYPPSLISSQKKIRSEPSEKENNFLCSFLSFGDNKCKIYPFRPFECRLYPFVIHKEGQEAFLAVDLKCPFIEENLKNKGYREYVEYLTAFLNKPDITEALKENPQFIQSYPEVSLIAKLKINP